MRNMKIWCVIKCSLLYGHFENLSNFWFHVTPFSLELFTFVELFCLLKIETLDTEQQKFIKYVSSLSLSTLRRSLQGFLPKKPDGFGILEAFCFHLLFSQNFNQGKKVLIITEGFQPSQNIIEKPRTAEFFFIIQIYFRAFFLFFFVTEEILYSITSVSDQGS